MIKIFRHSKGTRTLTSFEDGIAQQKIINSGQGYFLKMDYPTIQEASDFCQQELKKNQSDIFYLLNGDLIVGTVLDQKFQSDKKMRFKMIYGALSLTLFSLVGLGMSLAIYPYHTVYAHVAFTLGIGALYAFLLLIMGAGNFDGAVAMTMLLILLGISLPVVQKAQKRNQQLDRTTNSQNSK